MVHSNVLLLNCRCNCDGSYNCPAHRTVDLCSVSALRSSESCMMCEAAGKSYEPNEKFEYTEDCRTYECHCACNGSKVCELKSIDTNCGPSWRPCRSCNVKGNSYPPMQRFQYTEACERFDCQCDCNGEFRCPAYLTTNICGQSHGKCIDCDVRGVTYSGDSVFVLREQCLQYECACACDGKWTCNKEKTTNVCKNKTQG